MACCTHLRADDGVVDRVAVERATMGHATLLTRREREMVIHRLAARRGWGLDRIAQHTGFSRSQISVLLAMAKTRGGL